MIVNKGVTILAINQKAKQVLIEGPDGKTQICDVLKWFRADGSETTSDLLAETFGFQAHGFDEQGNEVTQPYQGSLQGMGEAFHRNPDGSFGEGRKRGVRMQRLFEGTAARDGLPGVTEH